jgi:hypothetical protein
MLPQQRPWHSCYRSHRGCHLSILSSGALSLALRHGGLITGQAGTADSNSPSYVTDVRRSKATKTDADLLSGRDAGYG